jgi:2-oxoglutarate dehydrogenase E2 component (dihydrolipoamide succinyltransferase)
VLRDFKNRKFLDTEKDLRDLALKARNGQLSLEEMSGGNFTISKR